MLLSLDVLAELLPDVEQRARRAASLEADSIIDNRAAWDEAIASIHASERYGSR